MKLALVYDRVNKFGGAERLLLQLHKIYPNAPIYTLVYNRKTSAWANNIKIIPSFFNSIPFLRTRHEILYPVSALAFENFNFSSFDIVISVTSESAKAILTKPETAHISYCLTPPRYLYTQKLLYRHNLKYRLATPFLDYFKFADKIYSIRPDYYLSISKTVSDRISSIYNRSSSLIHPPIDYNFWSKTTRQVKPFYLLVSRLVPYKNTKLAIKVFNQRNDKLLIVGTGSQNRYLKKISNPNIEFLGSVNDIKLRSLYSSAKALIFPQEEDFGLTPIEAQACGTSVIAYGRGGARETIIDRQTGVFFNRQTTDSLSHALTIFESGKHSISAKKCRSQASKFNQTRFYKLFSDKVTSLWQKHQTIYT